MRILQLSSLWPPTVLGGAELYASELAARLRRAGHEVGVVTSGVTGDDVVAAVRPWPYPLQDHAGQPPWKRVAWHARDQYDPVASRAVRAAIARFRPDVVHSHAVPGMSVSALTAPGRAGVAHVHTLHDYWLLCQRSTMVSRNDVPCADRCRGCRLVSAGRSVILDRHRPEVVLAVSEAVAEEHRGAGVLADRIRVVRNPIGDPPPSPRAPDPADPVVFGYLGQLVAIKGVRTLLEAFGSLAAGAELRVAGTGPLAGEVRGPGVTALGWVGADDRERFFASIDCLVVPSEWKDPAPLVLDEAAARGVPVIGADIGGVPELVTPADRDLLFRSGDAGSLRASLERFIVAPRPRRDAPLGANGWDRHLTAVVGAYAEAGALRTGLR